MAAAAVPLYNSIFNFFFNSHIKKMNYIFVCALRNTQKKNSIFTNKHWGTHSVILYFADGQNIMVHFGEMN